MLEQVSTDTEADACTSSGDYVCLATEVGDILVWIEAVVEAEGVLDGVHGCISGH